MSTARLSFPALLAPVFLSCAGAAAQWSSDPGNCLRVGDRPGEQNQPKIRATADGGCYIAWFDNAAGGYDVYLQRLNAQGIEQWPHNGILIADRNVSSTVDYDLIVDDQGHAVITYNDDTVVAGTQQVQVQKVSTAGTLLWGPQGITVSDGSSAFKANPRVCQLGDGSYVVGHSMNNTASFQRLDGDGNSLWPAPLVVSETYQPPTNPLHYVALSDLQPGDGASFIALFIRGRTQSSLSNKSLHAQKFDSSGTPQWEGAAASNNAGSPVIVFDAGSTNGIQNGYQPAFLPDGSGGAVFGWYESGGSRNAYIQHILASGSLKFPAPISNTGATPGRIRLGAALAYNAAAGTYFLASPEGSGTTTIADSLLVQKFDSAGARQWTDSGRYAMPITSGSQPSFAQCQPSGDGCMVFCITPSGLASGVIFGAGLAGNGTVAWSNLPCSAPDTKSRLASTLAANGSALLAFGHGGGAAMDILAQNVHPDGALGNPSECYPNCDSSITPPMLNVADFSCFLQKFAAAHPYANCDQSTVLPVLNVADFSCFLQQFAAGCR